MTYAELIARDKALTDAKSILLQCRTETTDFGFRKLTHAFEYLYSNSNATSVALNHYFAEEVPA